MNVWRRTTLGRVLPFKYGRNLPEGTRSHSGEFAVVSSAGFIDTHFEALTQGPAVIIGRKGSIGSVFFSSAPVFPIDTTFYVEGSDEIDLRFAYYLLRSLPLSSMNTDAAVPGLNRENAERLEINLPSIPQQLRITQVLGSIDDLIDNNRRRVELLEGLAKSIYREWFVEFRFPGHADVPPIEGTLARVPAGWDTKTIGDILELKYGKALKADRRAGGSVAVVGSSGVVGWHDVPLVEGPSVVVGRKGNLGSITWLDGPSWPIDTTYYVDTKLPLRFVAEQLRGIEFLNSHAAVPGLSRDMAYSKPFLVPPKALMDDFQQRANAIGNEASSLSAQSQSLARLRDLIAPRLMSGQIDMPRLDLNSHRDEAGA